MTKNKIEQPKFMESIVNEILAKYRKLDSLVSHAPSKGNYHENILRDVIRNYLPNTYSTGEGFIINQDGKTSSQLDVLIVDNIDPRSFGYKEKDFFIASDIAVACFGEVKTYCTKSEFIKSFHNLIYAKMLLPDSIAPRVGSFLFCYDAYASTETFAKWVDAAIEKFPAKDRLKTWHLPKYVYCLKKRIMHEAKINPLTPQQIQYWHATSTEAPGKILDIEQKIMRDLFQCVTDGCGKLRQAQGITLLLP